MQSSATRALSWPLFGLLLLLTLIFLVVWQLPRLPLHSSLMPLWLHTTMEVFSIIVDLLIFGIAWNAYSSERPANIIILATALLAVGLIDLAHTLSFLGMPDFVTPSGREKGINFWLAARAISSIALLAIAIHPWRPFAHSSQRYWLLAASFAIAGVVLWLGLAHQEWWPATYSEAMGLTTFKIGSEYLFITLLLVAAWLFGRRMLREGNGSDSYLLAAVWISILSELCFTLYAGVTDLFNLLGHLYKVIAYIFIYRAVFVVSVREPYQRLHQVRDELELQKGLLDAQGEASVDGILTVGLEGDVLWYNRRFAELWGIASEVMASRRAMRIRESLRDKVADYEGFTRRIDELYRQQEEIAWDDVLLKDGRVFDRYSAPVVGPNGSYLARIWLYRDITERRQAALKLQQSEEKMRTLFDSVNDGVVLIAPSGIIVDVNKYGHEHLGYSREEMVGHELLEFVTGDYAWLVQQHLVEVMASGHKRYEAERRRKDGTTLPVEVDMRRVELKGEPLLLGVVRDISERKAAEQRICELAYSDVLTGLPNRAQLHERLGREIAKGQQEGRGFALLYLDLDRFKYVNDSMGHIIGDLLLGKVAQRLQGHIGEGDIVSRIGGDEFVILLHATGRDDAARFAETLLQQLAEPYDVDGVQIISHASIGIALYPHDAQKAAELIQYADAAMYAAKEQGRNRYAFFTSDLSRQAVKVFSMEKDLRQALARGEFLLHYQPQFDLASGRITGAEALVRWHHPQRGMVSPAEFIPIAEETGQIVELGAWILHEACRQLAQWRREGLMVEASIAVNLSVRQLLMAGFLDEVTSAVRSTGLRFADLELEVTESIMVGDSQLGLELLQRLRSHGMQLSIDDFGTGYSSLSYLKRMPIDKLKIDQSFVREIEFDATSKAIIRSIITLGHQLELKVIAEGVESEAQHEFLRLSGCNEVQGYLISRPLPVEEFTQFARQRQGLI